MKAKRPKRKSTSVHLNYWPIVKMVNADAMPFAENDSNKLPDYFVSADDIAPRAHVDVQAAAQKWIDSSISKTANVPYRFPL